MNLRILKKLSKRAAPLLEQLGDERKQFRAEPGENYHVTVIRARKHFERGRSPHADLIWPDEIKHPAKDGNGYVYMHPPTHPLKGTVMVGAVSGYYEPEWDEETAWDALRQQVYYHFMDYDENTSDLKPTRVLRTPSDIFAAARDMIEAGTPAHIAAVLAKQHEE